MEEMLESDGAVVRIKSMISNSASVLSETTCSESICQIRKLQISQGPQSIEAFLYSLFLGFLFMWLHGRQSEIIFTLTKFHVESFEVF